MPAENKRLRIMAGPNGSGKTTILQEVRKSFYSGPFVNADEIEKTFRETGILNVTSQFDLETSEEKFRLYLAETGQSWVSKVAKESSSINIECKEGVLIIKHQLSPYDSAIAADFIRQELLLKGETFTFETVLSHKSKVDFLQKSIAAGFSNYLYFICTVDPAINIKRVKQREALKGHSVPEDKIVSRYHDSLKMLKDVVPLCHRVYFFDNSTEERSIDPVAEIDNEKRLITNANDLPWWLEEFVIKPLYSNPIEEGKSV